MIETNRLWVLEEAGCLSSRRALRFVDVAYRRLELVPAPGNASEVLSVFLNRGRSVVAGRLAGAFRNIDRDRIADDVRAGMRAAGCKVTETEPFEDASLRPHCGTALQRRAVADGKWPSGRAAAGAGVRGELHDAGGGHPRRDLLPGLRRRVPDRLPHRPPGRPHPVLTAMVSLASAMVLAHAMVLDPVVWWICRGITGLSFAVLFLVIESWLNERSTNENRGRLFSIYTIINFSVVAVGQMMLTLADPRAFTLFAAASILISLAALPVALTRAEAPAPLQSVRIRLLYLYRCAPSDLPAPRWSDWLTVRSGPWHRSLSWKSPWAEAPTWSPYS